MHSNHFKKFLDFFLTIIYSDFLQGFQNLVGIILEPTKRIG